MAEQPETSNASGAANGGRPAGRAKRVLLIIAVTALLVLLAWGLHWWFVGRYIQSTNDAYLHADAVTISPNVTGLVESVLVAENEAVKAGQPLVKVDSRTYEAALQQAVASVDARKADIARAEAGQAQQQAAIEQARAQLSASRLAARFADSQVARYEPLAASGAETTERLEELKDQRDQARARQLADEAALSSAGKQLVSLEASVTQARAQLESAEASVRQAQIDLDHTVIKSSVNGRIGDKSVRVGQFVQPGTRMMSVVPVTQLYVTANFKENQIGRMRIGQAVTIKVDALPDADITGRIESFAPGTGAQFALLPPENATGNFTKIVQRVPVRASVQATPEARSVLVPGLSVTVTVDTRGTQAIK